MTKYKGTIRLKDKPMKMIKWFTQNYKNEIGAIGIGNVANGELIIEKLLFPKQIVNGTHVHFKPEDWGEIVKDTSMEELSKVIFYWHKHPDNMPGASSGDEDDTIDVFMDENSERKVFGFLQTCKKTGGGIDYEARIEMRDPIWISMENVEITSDEDDAIADECQNIIETKITEGYASSGDQPGMYNKKITESINGWSYNSNGYLVADGHNNTIAQPTIDNNYDKPLLFAVTKKNGNILIYSADYFDNYITEILTKSNLEKLYVSYDMDYKKDGTLMTTIFPKNKKGRKQIYNTFKDVESECNIKYDPNESYEKTTELTTEEEILELYKDVKENGINEGVATYKKKYNYN